MSEVDMSEAGRAERERVDREQWLGRFPGGIPPYPTSTPEEDAHWARWAEAREAVKAELKKMEKREAHKKTDEFMRQKVAKDQAKEAMKAELDQEMPIVETESEADMSESASVSAKPAAEPKAAGRCKEGDLRRRSPKPQLYL